MSAITLANMSALLPPNMRHLIQLPLSPIISPLSPSYRSPDGCPLLPARSSPRFDSYSTDKTHRYSTDPCAAKTLAQQRRQLENEEFALLSRELPLARAISGQHIDKVGGYCNLRVSVLQTTMVRLSVAHIKLHKNLQFPKGAEARHGERYWDSHQLEVPGYSNR